jgi:hypothetical protein
MIEYDERVRRRIYLFTAILLVLLIGYRAYQRDRKKVRASSELKQGMKALTNPESLVKDLE